MVRLHCTACHELIPEERIIRNSAYCSCGHIATLGETEESRRDTILLRRILFMVVVAVLVSTHLINWKDHSFEIIPLKAKQVIGFANATDLREIVAICDDRKKWNCEVEALAQIFAKNGQDLAVLAQMAAVQSEHGQPVEAGKNYNIYFRLGGRDDSVRLQYARLLVETNHPIEARKQFSYLITPKHDKPQFQVAREYVHFLMKNHDYPTARTVIADYRKLEPSASMFLNSEWIEINDTLKTKSGRIPAASRSAKSIFQ
jgi:hypothetical protein